MRRACLLVLLLPATAWAAPGVPSSPVTPNTPTFNIQAEIDTKCGGAPLGIVELNGKTASKGMMDEARFQVTKFIAESDAYQDCVLRASAAVIKQLTRPDKIKIVKIIYLSQAEKEAVGQAFNQAVDDYSLVHGIALQPDPAPPGGTKPVPAAPATAKPPASAKPAAPATLKPSAKPAAPAKPPAAKPTSP